MTSYFIYYRVAPGREPFAEQQTLRLQGQLSASLGARCRLMRKRGEPDLWMEVYEAVGNAVAFERALAEGVRELELEELLAPGSRRHVECFED